MVEFTATNDTPDQNFIDKVRSSVDYNHPAEETYREGRKNKAAVESDAIEYLMREVVDGDATYVIEDREDGPYVTARKDGDEPIRAYGESGIKLDEVPEDVVDKDTMDRVGEVVDVALEVGEGGAKGLGLGTTRSVANVARAAVDNPIGEFVVGKEDVEQFEQFTKDFIKDVEGWSKQSGITGKEFGTAGKIAVDVGDIAGQFVLPAGGLFAGFRAMGAGAVLSSVLADGLVGFLGVAPEAENLANIIPEDSEAFGALRDLIATDPEDSDFANRSRNAVETIALLGVGEAVGRGIVKVIKTAKEGIKNFEVPESIGKAIDTFIKDESGTVKIPGLDDKDPLKAPGRETVDRAAKVIGTVEGKVVPEDIALQVKDALKKTGNAEGIDFNLSRMDTPDQLNQMIDEVSEIYKEPIKKAKRGVETFSETQAKADMSLKMGFDVDQVLERQSGELWPAHKIKAARDIFVSEMEKTEQLARAIKGGENTSENMVAFRRQLAVLSGVQSQIKGVQTETARALSQYRMTAKSAMERQVNIAEMIQKSGGSEMNETMVDAYLNVIDNGGPDAAASFARNAEQVTGWDMLYESWINSLLGSPATHGVNMLGNSLTINQAVIERYAAATYATAERGVKRALGKQATEGITFSEANAFAQGQVMAVNDALVAMLKALKTGESGDIFGKIDYHGAAITTQNINELPLAKTITSKLMKGDELIQTNSQLAHMVDYAGEYYYRMPGRFLMAEDELFKTMNYRAELHAIAAREAGEQGLSKEARVARMNEILADPQLNAPELHKQAFDFAREQTFTTPPGATAQSMREFLNNAEVGNFPAGRVVVPFFNVINNITKYTLGRVPGLGLVNPNSKTYKDFFSKDPAKRQLIMGKWATGGSMLGFGAWASMNGICTGRISDNRRMLNQIETTQGKKRYSCHLPGTKKTFSYTRLEPAGMLMAIGADTANVLAYIDDEEGRQNLVLAATAAIVPYMEDKSFFSGISQFMEAFNPQFGSDENRTRALGRYFTNILAGAPGAVLGPLAPGTPLSRNIKTNIIEDRAKRVTEANKWTIEKDQYGDDIMVADSESYRMWERTINKIMSATPGLSSSIPADVNIWGEEIRYEGGLGPDLVTPIYTNTPTFDVKDLQGHNFPKQIEAGRFRDMRVGSDLTIEQHRKFVDVVGIDGELERLNMPLGKMRRDISARVNGRVIGLPVELNPADKIDLIKIMNEIRVPNDAHEDRKRMNMKEVLNWMIKQQEYAILPDDRDATGAKGDLIRKVHNEYKGAAIELFFAEHPKGQAYFRKSVEMKQKAQNTGVQ